MDSNEQNKVIAFDTLFSTNHIQMLKVILPYMDHQVQKSLAVFIKFLEFNYTMEFYKNHPFPLCGCVQKEAALDFSKMLCDIFPYCTAEEKKQMEKTQGIFKSMDRYKDMAKTMEVMKDIMPDMGDMFSSQSSASGAGDASHSGMPFDMMGMLMNMLSPEQKEMFDLFGGNNNAD